MRVPIIRGPHVDVSHFGPAAFAAHGSVDQVWITDALPGQQLLLVDEQSRLITKATADAQGSLIFRNVREGRGFRVAGVGNVSTPGTVSAPFDVTGVNDSARGVALHGADDRRRVRIPADSVTARCCR